MSILEDCLRQNNHFATLYNSAYERIQLLEEQSPDPVNTAYVKLHFEDRNDPRTYNLPTAEEVAVILPGPGEPTDHRDIILQLKAGHLKQIYETSPAYAPLHYVLLFPRGE
ncbi:hypothetical protein GYMLUDRAFT_168282, partial [Collybiopsis luxurians FD-317 M1]